MATERIYRVRRHGGAKLHYLSHLGKMYTELWAALARAKTIREEGGQATVYYADVDWQELEESDG